MGDFCILRMLRLLLPRLDLVGWIVADLPAVELGAVGQDQLLLLVTYDGLGWQAHTVIARKAADWLREVSLLDISQSVFCELHLAVLLHRYEELLLVVGLRDGTDFLCCVLGNLGWRISLLLNDVLHLPGIDGTCTRDETVERIAYRFHIIGFRLRLKLAADEITAGSQLGIDIVVVGCIHIQCLTVEYSDIGLLRVSYEHQARGGANASRPRNIAGWPGTGAQTTEILTRLLVEDLHLSAVAGCHEEVVTLDIYIPSQGAVGIADTALQFQRFRIGKYI